MIKYFYVILLIYSFLCSCSKHTFTNRERNTANTSIYDECTIDSTAYKVMEIKKENSWYFIYLQRNDSIFKVVSHEPRYITLLETNNHKIEEGRKYNLTLISWKNTKLVVDGINYWPLGFSDGATLDSITTVRLEPENGIWDLYDAEELVGLYYFSGSSMSKIQPLL